MDVVVLPRGRLQCLQELKGTQGGEREWMLGDEKLYGKPF